MDNKPSSSTHKSKPSLPPGWTVHISSTYPDRVYYFNELTNCTTWNLPIVPAVRPPSPVDPPFSSPEEYQEDGPPTPEPGQKPEQLYADPEEELLLSDNEDSYREAAGLRVPSLCESTFLDDGDVDDIVLGLQKPRVPEHLLKLSSAARSKSKPLSAVKSSSVLKPPSAVKPSSSLKPAIKNVLAPSSSSNSKQKSISFKSTAAEKTYIKNSKIKSSTGNLDSCSDITEDFYESVQSKRPVREVAIDFNRATNGNLTRIHTSGPELPQCVDSSVNVVPQKHLNRTKSVQHIPNTKIPNPKSKIIKEKSPNQPDLASEIKSSKEVITKSSSASSKSSQESQQKPKTCEKRGVKRQTSSESSHQSKKHTPNKTVDPDVQAQKLLLIANFKLSDSSHKRLYGKNDSEVKSLENKSTQPKLSPKQVNEVLPPDLNVKDSRSSPAFIPKKKNVPTIDSNRNINSKTSANTVSSSTKEKSTPTAAPMKNNMPSPIYYHSKPLDPKIPRIPKVTNRSENSDVSENLTKSPIISDNSGSSHNDQTYSNAFKRPFHPPPVSSQCRQPPPTPIPTPPSFRPEKSLFSAPHRPSSFFRPPFPPPETRFERNLGPQVPFPGSSRSATDLREKLSSTRKNTTVTSLLSDKIDHVVFDNTKTAVQQTSTKTSEVTAGKEKEENQGPADYEDSNDGDFQLTEEKEENRHSKEDIVPSSDCEVSKPAPEPVVKTISFSSLWGKKSTPKSQPPPSVLSFGEFWSEKDKISSQMDLEEDMEWETTAPETSETWNDPSLPPDLYTSFSIDAWHIIVDTNILLSDLEFIEELRDSFFKDRGLPNIVVPWVALQELDNLKSEKNKSDLPTKYKAAAAVSFIHTNFNSDHPRFKGQSLSEFCQHDYPSTYNNDDKILHFCDTLQKKGRKVTLLTNDIVLCSKALASRIEAVSKRTMQKRLKKIAPIPDSPITTVPEKTSDPVYAPMLHIPEAQEADRILCNSKLILKDVLSEALKSEMKRVFKGMWERIIIKKPPWTLEDTFVCIKKHWISIFGSTLPKNALDLIETSQEYCFQFRMRKGFELKLTDAKAFVDTCRSFCMCLTQIKELHEKNKEAITKLDILLRQCDNSHFINSSNTEMSTNSSLSFTESSNKNDDIEDSFSQYSGSSEIPLEQQLDAVLERYQNLWERVNNVCLNLTILQSGEDHPNRSRVFTEVQKHIGNALRTVKQVHLLTQKILDGNLDAQSKEASELHSVLILETTVPEIGDPFTVETLCSFISQKKALLESTQKEFYNFISNLNAGIRYLMSLP